MAMYGTFILCFGWFGFNAGSTLAGSDSRIAVIAVNTMLAGCTGTFAAWPMSQLKAFASSSGLITLTLDSPP